MIFTAGRLYGKYYNFFTCYILRLAAIFLNFFYFSSRHTLKSCVSWFFIFTQILFLVFFAAKNINKFAVFLSLRWTVVKGWALWGFYFLLFYLFLVSFDSFRWCWRYIKDLRSFWLESPHSNCYWPSSYFIKLIKSPVDLTVSSKMQIGHF